MSYDGLSLSVHAQTRYVEAQQPILDDFRGMRPEENTVESVVSFFFQYTVNNTNHHKMANCFQEFMFKNIKLSIEIDCDGLVRLLLASY